MAMGQACCVHPGSGSDLMGGVCSNSRSHAKASDARLTVLPLANPRSRGAHSNIVWRFSATDGIRVVVVRWCSRTHYPSSQHGLLCKARLRKTPPSCMLCTTMQPTQTCGCSALRNGVDKGG